MNTDFKVISHEYNEYLVGFVLKTSKEEVHLQFNQVYSNHPQPAWHLDIIEEHESNLDIVELTRVQSYIAHNLKAAEVTYTEAVHNGMPFACPLCWSQIENYAEKGN